MGIIGGNGAGKSTLFRMIMGEEAPDGGQLRLGDTVVPMYADQDRWAGGRAEEGPRLLPCAAAPAGVPARRSRRRRHRRLC